MLMLKPPVSRAAMLTLQTRVNAALPRPCYSHFARMNSQFVRTNSQFGCVGNWAVDHWNHVTFSAARAPIPGRIRKFPGIFRESGSMWTACTTTHSSATRAASGERSALAQPALERPAVSVARNRDDVEVETLRRVRLRYEERGLHRPAVAQRPLQERPGIFDLQFSQLGEFVYHCHILEHEDGGMMARIMVVPAPN